MYKKILLTLIFVLLSSQCFADFLHLRLGPGENIVINKKMVEYVYRDRGGISVYFNYSARYRVYISCASVDGSYKYVNEIVKELANPRDFAINSGGKCKVKD